MKLTKNFIYCDSTTNKLRHNNEVNIINLPLVWKAFYLNFLKINYRQMRHNQYINILTE